MSGESSFWTEAPEDHRQLAKNFYKNIELTHPYTVTSRRLCPCLDFTHYCGWATTSVTYPTYQGAAI